MTSVHRIYNFAAGPAVLPAPVLEEIQRDLLALPGVGMSILEISHRSKTFESINERLASRGIRDDAHFAEVLPRYPLLAEHPELRNWFEILELDDVWIFDPANADRVSLMSP